MVPKGHNVVGDDMEVRWLVAGCLLVKSIQCTNVGRTGTNLCSCVDSPFVQIWIDCSEVTALVRSKLCGKNGDIGGGCWRTVSKLSSINESVFVAVTIGSLHVVGKKSTVFDLRIDFVISIQS